MTVVVLVAIAALLVAAFLGGIVFERWRRRRAEAKALERILKNVGIARRFGESIADLRARANDIIRMPPGRPAWLVEDDREVSRARRGNGAP